MPTHECILPLEVRLSGQANYSIWKALAQNCLDYYDVLGIILGTETRPEYIEVKPSVAAESTSSDAATQIPLPDEVEEPATDNQQDIDIWDKKNKFAKVFLQLNIEPDILPIITPYTNAHEMWMALTNKFDRKNASTTHSLLKTIATVQRNDEGQLTDRLAEPQRLWSTLIKGTPSVASSTRTERLGWILNGLSLNSEAKGAFLLFSLPPSYDDIVVNLQTKEGHTYDDIYEELIDISTCKQQTAVDKSAYSVIPGNQDNKKKSQGSMKTECTYCNKKAGKTIIGHTYQSCFKSMEEKCGAKQANTTSGTVFFCSFLDAVFDHNDTIPDLFSNTPTPAFLTEFESSESSEPSKSPGPPPSLPPNPPPNPPNPSEPSSVRSYGLIG